MQTFESNGQNDYIYYPIEYRVKALSTLVTMSQFPNAEYSTWVILIDKSKFLNGVGKNYISGNGHVTIISVGF